MRLLHWDDLNPHSIPPNQPYLWDDGNLFFGADGLGYAREPNDPGFIPYAPNPSSVSTATPKKKRNTMAKSDYIKNRDAEFSNQLNTFELNIGGYSTTLATT